MSKTKNIIAQVLERMLPVGSIVEWSPVDGGKTDLSTPEKVAAYYGFGVWEAYGSGRMLLGVSDSHSVGSMGGAEQVALTGENNGPHAHAYSGYLYNEAGTNGAIASSGGAKVEWRDGGWSTSTSGAGKPHENMPPYVVIHRWRRIA